MSIDSSESAPEPDAAYDELTDRFARVSNLAQGALVLSWDQQTMMPEGGSPARGKQLSALFASRHDHLTDERTGELLSTLESSELDDERTAVVREIRREYDHAVDVPSELVEELTEAQTASQRTWQDAKAEDDFASFAPTLEELRELHVERAEHIDPGKAPYEVMYEGTDPDLPLSTVERVFERLREKLVPLIADIEARGDDLPRPFAGEFPEADQRALCEAALDELGYDRSRGRLDTAPHPFMAGNQFDARVTTRFTPDDPLDALTATIHEFGHASYQLGLPQEHYGSPLGQSVGRIHESQSRFWENHVGRSRPFWERFLPTLKEHLDGVDDVTVDEAYAAVNRIYPENLIRVEADELTYHLHIILRTEIDSAFVAGEVDADDIPELWNGKMEEYLGVVPDTDAEGCLQDIHWSTGFASFQNYTVGSVLAAQLDAAVREDLDVDGLVREGEYEPIAEWMTEHVHRHGQRYRTDELVEVATGEPLTADYFLDYVDEKFGALYGL
ncbi:carboxypeptidase M32 [Halobium salinum]|uniref:Metal-dependent carboxypeptidase n=1 Tax=Halobium salinum TaxID=1364940 RepID=A0ABD5PBX5_9EURY|nr:carboxypeptidase M32 [Halobium salinum]